MVVAWWTATYPAGTDPFSACPAGGVAWVAPINSFTARRAFITVKSKPAVATDKHVAIACLGNDMDGTADQADGSHFRLVSDTVALFAVLFVKLFGRIPVKIFHTRSLHS
jgi:hypothetical protein